ncbi:MAG TPA: hypothetical protein VIP11_15765 [Gemmatimonadaceae bacterium]
MDEDIVAIVLAFVTGMTALGCVTAIILTLIKRRPHRLPEPDLDRRLDEIVDRLARLDGSIDTMAVEVERISEAQRFTAKVLAERGSAPVLPDKARAGSTTPH